MEHKNWVYKLQFEEKCGASLCFWYNCPHGSLVFNHSLLGFITEFYIFCKSTSIQTDKILFGNNWLLFRDGGAKCAVETSCILPTFRNKETKVGV